MIEAPKTWSEISEISEIEATGIRPMGGKDPGGSGGGGISLNIEVDVLGIAKEIASSIGSARNREAFVKDLMEKTFTNAGQTYNVMVFNLAQDYDKNLKGIKLYASATYTGGEIYGIWVFEEGEFTNKEDGGYINWAFQGWFERNGGHVKFSKP